MNSNIKRLAGFLILGGLLCLTMPFGIEADEESWVEFKPPLRHGSLVELIEHLLRWLYWVGIVGLGFVILVGAFQMVFSGGDPRKFEKGKKTIIYGAVGLAIILFSRMIVAIISSVLGP
jgi:hypothetical protein